MGIPYCSCIYPLINVKHGIDSNIYVTHTFFPCCEAFLISLFQKEYCKILPGISDQYSLSYIAVTIIFVLLHMIFQEHRVTHTMEKMILTIASTK